MDDVRIHMGGGGERQPTEAAYTSDAETTEGGERQASVEEDVCFPPRSKQRQEGEEEEEKVDYECLDDYVTKEKQELDAGQQKQQQQQRRTSAAAPPPTTPPNGHRYSFYGDRMKHPSPSRESDFSRITLYSSAAASSTHARSLAEIPPDGQYLGDILQKGCFWLDILSPTDAEMKILAQTFHIHPLTVEDISMEEQREKCEVFKSYYFICFRSFEQDQYSVNYLQPLSLYIVVLQEGVLTVSCSSCSWRQPPNLRVQVSFSANASPAQCAQTDQAAS